MIDPNVTAAVISSTSSMVVAVVALVLNHQGFKEVNRRLDRIEADLKDFDKTLARQEVDIGRLKDKAGLS